MTSQNRHRRLIFNYRLSRARRVVENTFGILAAKWRVYRQPIIAGLDTVDAIVKATCVLHNFLRRRDGVSSDHPYMESSDIDEEDEDPDRPRTEDESGALRALRNQSSNNATREAKEARERLADFVLSPEGALPWQERVVRRGQLGRRV